MSLLRDIWADLVEKRLWPVALLLVAAMIAAPVVLAGGSGGEAPATPVAAPAPAPAAAPSGPAARAVSLDEAPVQPAPRGGYKDPFAGSIKAAAEASAPTTAAAPAAPATSATPAPGLDGPRDTPAGSAAPAPAASPPPVDPITAPDTTPDAPPSSGVFAGYRVDLHWGRAGAAKRMRDVVRLGRLDAGEEPLLVYFGVRHDGKRALFLLTTDAGAVGDGRCMPAENACQIVELRAGESQFFDVVGADGSIEQYELDLDRITKRYADTRAEARELAAERSKRGLKLFNAAVQDGRDYVKSFDYVRERGGIVRNVKATNAWYSQATNAEVGKTSAE